MRSQATKWEKTLANIYLTKDLYSNTHSNSFKEKQLDNNGKKSQKETLQKIDI